MLAWRPTERPRWRPGELLVDEALEGWKGDTRPTSAEGERRFHCWPAPMRRDRGELEDIGGSVVGGGSKVEVEGERTVNDERVSQ